MGALPFMLELVSSTMPPKPRSSPSTWRLRIGSPSGMNASTPIIQNGITDTSTAATPLGTNCCAHTRQPLPKPIINKPSSA